jgi:hypothetical protein
MTIMPSCKVGGLISELQKQKNRRRAGLINDRKEVRSDSDAYYATDANGKPTGVPFCLRCWENEHKKRQLVRNSKVIKFGFVHHAAISIREDWQKTFRHQKVNKKDKCGSYELNGHTSNTA